MSTDRPYYDGPYGSYAPPYYTGFYNLGPISIPPKVAYVGMTDEVTGTVYYLAWNGTAISLQTTNPGPAVNVITYASGEGPFLPLSLRARVRSGALSAVEDVGVCNLSQPAWIYRIGNVAQQTWPEPTNIPTQPAPTIPGIPSSAPPPTGGGYAAWVANQPNNLPPLLTTILTKGYVKNMAFWNGTAWVTPAGVPLVGVM